MSQLPLWPSAESVADVDLYGTLDLAIAMLVDWGMPQPDAGELRRLRHRHCDSFASWTGRTLFADLVLQVDWFMARECDTLPVVTSDTAPDEQIRDLCAALPSDQHRQGFGAACGQRRWRRDAQKMILRRGLDRLAGARTAELAGRPRRSDLLLRDIDWVTLGIELDC